jgi:DNA-damage-inducible protein J
VNVILNRKGLSASKAINLFYKQIKIQRDIPFEIHIPNKITRKAMDESTKGKKIKKFKNIKELFEDLDK